MLLPSFFRVSLSVIFSIGLVACSDQSAPPEPLARPVSVFPLSDHANGYERRLTGVLQPAETAELSFEVSGKVETVNVDLGSRFKGGDLLASLDNRNYVLAVEEQEGALAEAKARLVEARNDFSRKEKLVAKGAVSQSVYDSAKALFEAAEDQVSVAQSRLQMAHEDLADTQLLAPYAGTVAVRAIEPSQQIASGTPVFEIQGNSALEVSLLVPENLLYEMRPGLSVDVQFPAHNLTAVNDPESDDPKEGLVARVTEIGTRAGKANAFPVTLTLEHQSDTLKAGMSAEVVFHFNRQLPVGSGRYRIPASALGAGPDNQHFVFRVRDQQLQKVSVSVQELQSDAVYLTGDLAAGDLIVRTGLAFLQDNQPVRVLDDTPKIYNP